MKTRILFSVGAFLLLGVACQRRATPNKPVSTPVNSQTTNTATANTIDPCLLLTQAEAESVFGKAAQTPVVKGTACRYDTVDATKFFDLTAKAGTSSNFETMKNLCGSTTQPVAGLGDTSCAANNTVVVLKNTILMTLIAGGVFDQDQLNSLAVTAANRIS